MSLEKNPFFLPFSVEVRKALMDAGAVKSFRKGEAIFEVGDKDTDFYLLVGGRVRIYKLSRGGQKRILRTVQPGDTFALVSLFDEQPMFINAEVLGEEAQVFIILREKFMKLLKEYHELSRFVIDGLVRRIRRYGEAMTNMTVYSTEQRFISYLFELLEHHDHTDSIHLPDSVTTIAEQLGTVREVLSREISKMVKKGWIKKTGQVIEVLNRPALVRRLKEV